MAGKEIFRLVLLVAFTGIVFIAGFVMGASHEYAAWQEEATQEEAAHWQRDEDGFWVFRWTTSGNPTRTPGFGY